MAAVALLLPAAAVGKLQPSVMTSLPYAYDYKEKQKRHVGLLWQEVCSNNGESILKFFFNETVSPNFYTKTTGWNELMSKSEDLNEQGRG